MPNDTRDNRAGSAGVLRGARTSIGMEGQEVRAGQTGNRGEHVSRGSYINYYDDLGISTTQGNAGVIRKQESDFQTSAKEQQEKITAADKDLQTQYTTNKTKLDQTKSGIKSASEIIAETWGKTKSTFFPVRVTNGNSVEGTYYLPKDSVYKLAADGNLRSMFVDDGKYLNIDVRNKGDKIIGKELHTSLSQAERDLYNNWYVSNAGKITNEVKTAQSEFDKQKKAAYDNLNTQYTTEYGKVMDAKNLVDSAIYKRAAEWEQLRTDYTKKKATIAEIFGNLKVEEAKPNEESV